MGVITSLFYPHAAIKFAFYFILQMAAVYFNLYFLIPRLLAPGRYAAYIFSFILTTVVTAWLIVIGYPVSAAVAGKTLLEMYGVDTHQYFKLFEGSSFPSTAAAMTLAMSIKLTRDWLQAKRKEQLMEREKLETELKFLKSQFNPHFLFNTINSIFVLINKNPTMASESLARFSELLRYQLYECNEHQIPLAQELAYLENFIALEKLRQDKSTQWQFDIEPPGNYSLSVAPFILMPFIENSFKHLSQHRNKINWIKMALYCKDYELHFSISNSYAPHQQSAPGINQYSGIGLKNVYRRLDLLYPGRHTLTINDEKDHYQVTLVLDLSPHKLVRSA